MLSPLLLLLACVEPSGSDIQIEATASATEIASVVRLSWEVDGVGAIDVHWTDSRGEAHITEAMALDASAWEALLVAHVDDVLTWELYADGQLAGSGEATTEDASGWPEVSTVSGQLTTTTATTLFEDDGWVPILLDGVGEPRWWLPPTDSSDLGRMTVTRVRTSASGVWVGYFMPTPEEGEIDSTIVHYGWDGSVLETVDAPRFHHDFWVFDDGGLMWIAFEEVDSVGGTTWGDQLVYRSPAGDTEVFWSSWDQLPVTANSRTEEDDTWTWANHLDFNGENWVVMLHNLSVAVLLDDTGETIGIIGELDDEPGLANYPLDDPFRFPHGGTLDADGQLVLHDNAGAENARAVAYALDDDSGVGELAWEYDAADPDWRSQVLGDAVPLDNGDVLISWGLFGTFQQVDTDGETVGMLTWEPGIWSGFLTPVALD